MITLAALVCFAANSLLCRYALGEGLIDAASFTTVRLAAGALTLGVLMRTSGRPRVVPAIALFAYAAFFSFAYKYVTAATGALLLFGAVQATMLVGALLLGERLSRLQWFGLLVAISGLAYLLFPGLEAPPVVGVSLMLLSGAAWGIYSLQGAGHKVFQGEDVTLTLAEVVKAEPRWNDLPSEISPSVKTTLERCLKKDPKARIRDIGDARLALEGAFESQGVSETATAPRVPGLWLVAVGLFGLLAGFVLSAFRGEEAEARDPKRLVLLPPPDTRIEGFRWREFVISPDGSELVFRARATDLTHQLYRRPLDAFAAPPIPGTEGARFPVFSPDGKSLAFISDSGLLRKIPVEGGPLPLCATAVLRIPITGAKTAGSIMRARPGSPACPRPGARRNP